MQYFIQQATRHANSTAIIDSEGKFTYAELLKESSLVASLLLNGEMEENQLTYFIRKIWDDRNGDGINDPCEGERKAGYVESPLRGVEVRLADENNNDVATNYPIILCYVIL